MLWISRVRILLHRFSTFRPGHSEVHVCLHPQQKRRLCSIFRKTWGLVSRNSEENKQAPKQKKKNFQILQEVAEVAEKKWNHLGRFSASVLFRRMIVGAE